MTDPALWLGKSHWTQSPRSAWFNGEMAITKQKMGFRSSRENLPIPTN